jgi:hypothetical protein
LNVPRIACPDNLVSQYLRLVCIDSPIHTQRCVIKGAPQVFQNPVIIVRPHELDQVDESERICAILDGSWLAAELLCYRSMATPCRDCRDEAIHDKGGGSAQQVRNQHDNVMQEALVPERELADEARASLFLSNQ